MELVHISLLAYVCPKCPYRANLMDTMKNHIKRVHDKIKDFKCGATAPQFGLGNGLSRKALCGNTVMILHFGYHVHLKCGS